MTPSGDELIVSSQLTGRVHADSIAPYEFRTMFCSNASSCMARQKNKIFVSFFAQTPKKQYKKLGHAACYGAEGR